MIRSTIVAAIVIIGACAAMRPTAPEPGIAETRTGHVRGTPHRAFPQLEDRK